ncbi:hypothetical protein CASFOL_025990 [Castilleja foliolosa]|uniref:Ribosome biogenesis protein slx9-like n=1 Tax=Castilleja foliolosa TaxID=1961234 RepID=A0ABD3CSN7_9LAMI
MDLMIEPINNKVFRESEKHRDLRGSPVRCRLVHRGPERKQVDQNQVPLMGKISSRSDGKNHSDRKFEKKMQFYELVRGSVVEKAISKEKQKKRSRQKRLKAYDLSALSEYLPELSSLDSKPAEFKINCKTGLALLLKESNQLKTVINHPVFQSDPFGAIYQHLQNTQPAEDEKPKRKDSKTRKNKAKKKKSKDVQSMEI